MIDNLSANISFIKNPGDFWLLSHVGHRTHHNYQANQEKKHKYLPSMNKMVWKYGKIIVYQNERGPPVDFDTGILVSL